MLSLPVFAEKLQTIQLGNNHCAYESSHRITPGTLRLFSSDNEAKQVANRILRLQGMSLDNANFVLKAAIGNRIQNAAAVVQNQRRYLLYKQSFIQDANRRVGTNWEGISIMAHELAHVQNRDTLTMTITATLAGAISMLGNFAFFFGGNRDNNNPLGFIGVLVAMIVAPLSRQGRMLEWCS